MDVIRQTVRLMGWVVLLLGPITAALYGVSTAVGLVSGMVWALANVWALGRLIRCVLVRSRPTFWTHAGWWVLKMPLLYGVGAVLLLSPWSSPIGFLAGFSAWFLLLWLNALRGIRAPSS